MATVPRISDEQPPRAPAAPPPDALLWLDRHGDAMYAYARLRLGRPDLAEDAVQEALLAALTAAERFEARSSERTWLIGILRHKVLKTLERERRRRGDAPLDDGPADWPFEGGFWRHRQTPPPSMEAAELRDALRRALDTLPERYREVIVLREIEAIPDAEICKILGLSRTNLWTLVHRAKAALRTLLAEVHPRGLGGAVPKAVLGPEPRERRG